MLKLPQQRKPLPVSSRQRLKRLHRRHQGVLCRNNQLRLNQWLKFKKLKQKHRRRLKFLLRLRPQRRNLLQQLSQQSRLVVATFPRARWMHACVHLRVRKVAKQSIKNVPMK